MSDLLEQALQYAKQGWSTFPLQPGAKVPFAGSRGFRDASRDEAVLHEWFTFKDTTDCNLGLATGKGLVVIDVDPKNGGEDGLRELLEEYGTDWGVFATYTVSTPSGGRHYYFRAIAARSCSPRIRGKRYKGVDIRGDGGFVVSPPSQIGDRTYKVLGDNEVLDAPDWLLEPGGADREEVEFDGRREDILRASEIYQLAERANLLGAWESHGEMRSHRQVPCPGQDKHSERTFPEHTKLFVGDDGSVGLKCWHESCRPMHGSLLQQLRRQCEQIIGEEIESDPDLEVPDGFRFVPISELQPTSKIEGWVWDGYVAPGRMTVIHSEPKVGKTTLLTNLYQALETGADYCGRDTLPTRVFVATEEPPDNWIERQDNYDLSDHLSICTNPPVQMNEWEKWSELMRWAKVQAMEVDAGLVVFDTANDLWPVSEENDNMQVKAAIKTCRMLNEAGIAVVLAAHSSKDGSGAVAGLRGASSFGGAVDFLVHMRPVAGEREDSPLRELAYKGRSAVTPSVLRLELKPAGYQACPTGEILSGEGQMKVALVRSVLAEHPAGLTPQELKDELKGNGIGLRLLMQILRRFVKENVVTNIGGDGVRYVLTSSSVAQGQGKEAVDGNQTW